MMRPDGPLIQRPTESPKEWQVRCSKCGRHSPWTRRELDAQSWSHRHRCEP